MNVNNSSSQDYPSVASWRTYYQRIIAAEISSASRYFDCLVQFEPRATDTGGQRKEIVAPLTEIASSLQELKSICDRFGSEGRVALLLNGNLNFDLDIEKTLSEIHSVLNRHSRIFVIVFNPYLRWIYRIADLFGVRKRDNPFTFVTEADISALCKLSGFEVVRKRLAAYCPFKLGGIGNALNRILPTIPVIRWLALTEIVILRPVPKLSSCPSVSVIIPARNERGNIESALKRMPSFGDAKLEVVFVEGHSKDQTWEEIQRVLPLYSDKIDISAYQQSGKGKSDAVRLGFSKAKNELLMILDADLTMPPELLTRFYSAYCRGLGDFINGNRLTYPMEGAAMKPLNHLGNVFFAKALSYVLGMRLGDTLCGTKVLARRDYERMTAWRHDFGDFDPFGDFELLFPAAILGLGVVDVPIRYRDRTYGSTNILRFRHGLMLLKMTIIGFLRVLLGQSPKG